MTFLPVPILDCLLESLEVGTDTPVFSCSFCFVLVNIFFISLSFSSRVAVATFSVGWRVLSGVLLVVLVVDLMYWLAGWVPALGVAFFS